MEHAGLAPETMAGSLTGVFVGLTNGGYQLMAADAYSVDGPYGFTGTNFSLASGRIAYALGVHGPAATVDAACSSGMLAVHLTCRSLHGGACVILDPRKFASGSAQGLLSPTGRCHAFDVAADGFVVSEGCTVLLLKRLPDALGDGDRILAVVRGTAANQDGRTVNSTEMFSRSCTTISPCPNPPENGLPAYSTWRPSMTCAVRCRPSICRFWVTAAHHGLTVLHDDNDFVTAANLATELHERNIRAGPAASS